MNRDPAAPEPPIPDPRPPTRPEPSRGLDPSLPELPADSAVPCPPPPPTPHIAGSVKARLINFARSHGEDFNRVLDRFALERFLHRWTLTSSREGFALKGASLFLLEGGAAPRPSQDLDFLALGLQPTIPILEALARAACAVPCSQDGASFHPSTVWGELIQEHRAQPGIRLHLKGALGSAVLNVKMDFGFGDPLTQPLLRATYPSMLPDLPASSVLAYPWEAWIAEKAEAIVAHGLDNSRMKDFFDVWHLAATRQFRAGPLRTAILATFQNRGTPLPDPATGPAGFTPAFTGSLSKRAQWAAFCRTKAPHAPQDLALLVAELEPFLVPILNGGLTEAATWTPGSGWRP